MRAFSCVCLVEEGVGVISQGNYQKDKITLVVPAALPAQQASEKEREVTGWRRKSVLARGWKRDGQ